MKMATNRLWRGLLVVVLTASATLAQAELYTWVDKNGEKHYGDTVPPEHAKHAQPVETKQTNSMQSPPSVNYYDPPRPSGSTVQPDDTQTADETNSCEAQQQAYDASMACFNECRKHTKIRGKKINNVSECGHCTDAPKPNCE
jgi:hypothetical protein